MSRPPIRLSLCRPIPFHHVLAIGAALWATLQVNSASAQDGKTILQNMIGAYRNLNSYQGHANGSVRQIMTNGKTLTDDGFSTTLVYQKPNKLKLEWTDPHGGRAIYCDGKSLAQFRNKTQTFSLMPINAADLPQLCEVLKKLQIVGSFDTLYFLAGNGLPANVTDITRKPDDVRDGRPVYVVSAHEKTPARVYTLIWMIDKQTNMIARVQRMTSNAPKTINFTQPNRAGINALRVDLVVTQNIVDRTPNARVNADTFVFHAPQSAKRVLFAPDVQQSSHAPAGIPAQKGK